MIFISKLSSVCKTSGVLNIYMRDFEEDVNNSIKNFKQFLDFYYERENLIINTPNGYTVQNSPSINIVPTRTETEENENLYDIVCAK